MAVAPPPTAGYAKKTREKPRFISAARRGASARATERRTRGAGERRRTYELDVLRRREVVAQQLLRSEHHGTGEQRVRVFSRRRVNARGDFTRPQEVPLEEPLKSGGFQRLAADRERRALRDAEARARRRERKSSGRARARVSVAIVGSPIYNRRTRNEDNKN